MSKSKRGGGQVSLRLTPCAHPPQSARSKTNVLTSTLPGARLSCAQAGRQPKHSKKGSGRMGLRSTSARGSAAPAALQGGSTTRSPPQGDATVRAPQGDATVMGLTSREPYKSFSEAENVLGFYRKKFGEWGYVLQVRAPGEPPDLSFFAACDIHDDENRARGARWLCLPTCLLLAGCCCFLLLAGCCCCLLLAGTAA